MGFDVYLFRINKLMYTLWANFIDEINGYFKTKKSKPIIIIHQKCHSKRFFGYIYNFSKYINIPFKISFVNYT